MLVEYTKIKHLQDNYKMPMGKLDLDPKNVLVEKRCLGSQRQQISVFLFAG